MACVTPYKIAGGKTKYLARVTLKGFKRTSKGDFDSKAVAREWADGFEKELKARRDHGGARAEVGRITLRQLVERFLADPTVKQLKWLPDLSQLLGEWANEYGGDRVRSFGRLQKAAFRDKLLAQGLSFARANRYLAALRRAWKWGLQEGYVLPSQPWPPGLFLKEPAAKEVIATGAEVNALFAACDGEDEHLGSLVRFLVGTGARLSDALAVTWRDVDEKNGDVAIRGQKTSHPLRVAMLAPAKDAIRTAAKVKHVSGRVFWQYDRTLEATDKQDQEKLRKLTRMGPRASWLKARTKFPEHLQSMRLHDCRHLCASLLAANGATDVELAAQLGHSTLQMVKRYSHLRGGHRGAAHEKLDKAFSGA